MNKWQFRKRKAAYVGKNVLIGLAVPILMVGGAHAAAPDVKDAVADIGALQAPIALVGGAYIGLKVFQRGWRIIKGFI